MWFDHKSVIHRIIATIVAYNIVAAAWFFSFIFFHHKFIPSVTGVLIRIYNMNFEHHQLWHSFIKCFSFTFSSLIYPFCHSEIDLIRIYNMNFERHQLWHSLTQCQYHWWLYTVWQATDDQWYSPYRVSSTSGIKVANKSYYMASCWWHLVNIYVV